MQKKVMPIDIHWYLLNAYGDEIVNVNTIWQWVMCCTIGIMQQPTIQGNPCTDINPQNETNHRRYLTIFFFRIKKTETFYAVKCSIITVHGFNTTCYDSSKNAN